MNAKLIYLAQTDTTVGFLSQDKDRLAYIKQRDVKKPILKVVNSFEGLQKLTRVPSKFRKMVRKSSKITFIYPNNEAIRVINSHEHQKFISKFGWMYSTSANESGKKFEKEYAYEKADIIVRTAVGFFEGRPSSIVKIGKCKKKRIR